MMITLRSHVPLPKFSAYVARNGNLVGDGQTIQKWLGHMVAQPKHENESLSSVLAQQLDILVRNPDTRNAKIQVIPAPVGQGWQIQLGDQLVCGPRDRKVLTLTSKSDFFKRKDPIAKRLIALLEAHIRNN